MRKVKFVILGAGSAGLTAMSTIQKITDDFVMINGGDYGTTCARVGCMPSKALIQSANVYHKRHHFNEFGVKGADQVTVDVEAVMNRVRRLRDRFTGGVKSGSTEKLKEGQLINGYARFLAENQLQVNGELIQAERVIIATGSRPVIPAPWEVFAESVFTSDEIFEQPTLPKRVAVIGLGIIGLELGQAMSRLGVEVTGFELAENIGGLSVPEVNKKAIELMSNEFTMYLGEAAQLEKTANGVLIKTSKAQIEVDAVLASLGRRPNIDGLDLEKTGIQLNERGLPSFNIHTTQIENKPLFIAGDVNGDLGLLHEAADEGFIAGVNAVSDELTCYERRTPLSIVFCDPGIAAVGQRFSNLDQEQCLIGSVDFARQGRALTAQKNKGVLRIYAAREDALLLGAEMCAPAAEHMVHLLALAIDRGLTAHDLLGMPFYHPVLEEGLRSALRDISRQSQQSARPDLSACDSYRIEALD